MLSGRGAWRDENLASDPDAVYASWHDYDVTDLVPQVAVPHNVDQVVDVTEVAGTVVDQVFIGSCTNGRFEDLQEAGEVLGDRKFSDDVRVLVIPASRTEYLKALQAGLIEQFVRAGALVEAPCCGLGARGSLVLSHQEVSFSTSTGTSGEDRDQWKEKYTLDRPQLLLQQPSGERSPIHGRCDDAGMEIWR